MFSPPTHHRISTRRASNAALTQILAIPHAPPPSEHTSTASAAAATAENLHLRKQIAQLISRLTILEQSHSRNLRANNISRNLAAMFESYMASATAENAAMLSSHATIKQQVSMSESVTAALAERVITMVADVVNRGRQVEEVVAGHHAKIVEVDTRCKEVLHKVNQLQVRRDGGTMRCTIPGDALRSLVTRGR